MASSIAPTSLAFALLETPAAVAGLAMTEDDIRVGSVSDAAFAVDGVMTAMGRGNLYPSEELQSAAAWLRQVNAEQLPIELEVFQRGVQRIGRALVAIPEDERQKAVAAFRRMAARFAPQADTAQARAVLGAPAEERKFSQAAVPDQFHDLLSIMIIFDYLRGDAGMETSSGKPVRMRPPRIHSLAKLPEALSQFAIFSDNAARISEALHLLIWGATVEGMPNRAFGHYLQLLAITEPQLFAKEHIEAMWLNAQGLLDAYCNSDDEGQKRRINQLQMPLGRALKSIYRFDPDSEKIPAEMREHFVMAGR